MVERDPDAASVDLPLAELAASKSRRTDLTRGPALSMRGSPDPYLVLLLAARQGYRPAQ